MTKHLTRKELMEAARNRTDGENGHIRQCRQCRETVALLRTFDVAGQPALSDAPKAWIDRAASIAGTVNIKARVREIVANLTFDSWNLPQPVGVRDQSSICDRRLRFEVDDIVLDFRAERRRKEWSFVAQISPGLSGDHETYLELDGSELRADASGFYQWSSRRPPATIAVRSGERLIVLPELSWKNPPLK